MSEFLTHAAGAAMAPFLMVLFLCIAYPFKRAAEGLPDGWLRRLLLKRIGGASGRAGSEQHPHKVVVRDLRHLTPEQARSVLGVHQ
jgi:hypothetical protein